LFQVLFVQQLASVQLQALSPVDKSQSRVPGENQIPTQVSPTSQLLLTEEQLANNLSFPRDQAPDQRERTPLSYDILSYSTIIAISDADKDKMKLDSTSVSTWLKSVATFCALAFKKYPIELTAIIQYVINQLKNRKSYDLLILQEIVQKMCGIEVLSEVNDLQLEAMAGGDILRQEAGYFNPIRNIKKACGF